MVSRLAPALIAVATLASCTAYPDEPGRYHASDVPAARVVAPSVSCIQRSQVSETRVRDDYTIDFIRFGREGWRVTLPNRCPGLRAENAFTYSTSLPQLCSTDIIYVLETAGGLHRGPGCGLGPFTPIVLDRR
jgi:hypothetical protein